MKHETKKIKHTFSKEETTELSKKFRQAIKKIQTHEADHDAVKAQFKAKVAEAEAKGIDTLLDAGFEMRDVKCVMVYRPAQQEKDYYAETDAEDGKLKDGAVVLLTEKMTESDLQMELVEAEAKFELRDEIPLFQPAGADIGLLVVGRQNGKWFTALRASVGKQKLEERLDSEQKAVRSRPDAVAQAVKRFRAWLTDRLGKDTADGFAADLDSVVAAHKDREE